MSEAADDKEDNTLHITMQIFFMGNSCSYDLKCSNSSSDSITRLVQLGVSPLQKSAEGLAKLQQTGVRLRRELSAEES